MVTQKLSEALCRLEQQIENAEQEMRRIPGSDDSNEVHIEAYEAYEASEDSRYFLQFNGEHFEIWNQDTEETKRLAQFDIGKRMKYAKYIPKLIDRARVFESGKLVDSIDKVADDIAASLQDN